MANDGIQTQPAPLASRSRSRQTNKRINMLECTRASITTNSIAKEFSKGDKELQRLYEDVCDNFFVMLSNEIMSGETVKLPMRLGAYRITQNEKEVC
jgi:hypothetical protein